MDNKYYIPSIEEFHVGFEYEILTNYTKENEKWEFVNNPFTIERLEIFIENKHVRVKYLDKDDIESLGFKFTDAFGYTNKRHCIIPVNDIRGDNFYEICLYLSPKIVYYCGEIKNISRLKMILEWLKITD